MAVRKLDGQWVVEFELRKHRVFRRLPPGATKGQAHELQTKLRTEIIEQAVLGKTPTVGLDYAIQTWVEEVVKGTKSERETRNKAAIVRRGLSEIHGHGSQLRLGDAWGPILDGLLDVWSGLRPATINRRLCVLKAVARFAWRKGWAQENLSGKIQLLPGERIRHRVISQKQIRTIIAKAEDRQTKAFIALAAYAGLRQGEVMALTRMDITQTTITIRDSKSGKPRVVRVIAALRPFLREIPLLLHKRTLYARFEAARDAAGIEDLVYHDLRRSAASILLNDGADLSTVAHVLGHASLETTRKVYAMVSDRTAARAMDRAFREKPIKKRTGKARNALSR